MCVRVRTRRLIWFRHTHSVKSKTRTLNLPHPDTLLIHHEKRSIFFLHSEKMRLMGCWYQVLHFKLFKSTQSIISFCSSSSFLPLPYLFYSFSVSFHRLHFQERVSNTVTNSLFAFAVIKDCTKSNLSACPMAGARNVATAAVSQPWRDTEVVRQLRRYSVKRCWRLARINMLNKKSFRC